MSQTLARLEAILTKEADLHDRLLEAAEEKRSVLVKGSLPRLEELLELEQSLLGAVSACEREREKAAAAARRELGVPPDVLKLAAIAERAGPESGPRLVALRDRLFAVLKKLRHRTRQNAELLRAGMEHAENFLRAIAAAAAPKALYGRDGRSSGAPPRLLDRNA